MFEDFEIDVDEKRIARDEDFYEVSIRCSRKTEGATGVRAIDTWVYVPREVGDSMTWDEIVSVAKDHFRDFYAPNARDL